MYRHCIYCSARLGANEALEAFPVGRTLAFDAAKGRLWAVCGKCARWNLAPIEERWEAVEEAERAFRDTRLRAQSENIGLAKLRDGTRLIRVGAALQGEVAAWRYGDQLVKRRRRYVVMAGATAVGGLIGGAAIMHAAAGVGGLFVTFHVGNSILGGVQRWYRGQRPLYTLAASESPNGRSFPLRRRDLADASLRSGEEGGIELLVPQPRGTRRRHARLIDPPMVLEDRTARRVLERGLVYVNEAGADREALGHALRRIFSAGSAEEYVLSTAASRLVMEAPQERRRKMPPGTALALEIALHEEQERRALAGELSILEAAWRDAEPVAEIADRLALEPGTVE